MTEWDELFERMNSAMTLLAQEEKDTYGVAQHHLYPAPAQEQCTVLDAPEFESTPNDGTQATCQSKQIQRGSAFINYLSVDIKSALHRIISN